MQSVKTCLGVVLALGLSVTQLRGEVYQAPSPEPTDEETMILEYMNRFRADPKAEVARIVPKSGTLFGFVKVDWNMFTAEVEALKPAPPLVFNLKLLEAARKHSFYMIHNGLGHDESAGKQGYTGNSFVDRCRAVGYGSAGAENCYRDARGAWNSHAAFVVDWGNGGPGGMQPGRGHRTNMANGGFKEVGPSAVPHEDRFSVTHNFGSSGARFVGGVVYQDKNNNGQYDTGEGRGGVKLSASEGSLTMTWKSGAYALPLKGAAAVTITMESPGQSTTNAIPAGKENVKFDWIVPQEGELQFADSLLAKVEAVPTKDIKDKNFFKSVIELYMGAAHLGLDAKRAERVRALTKEVGPQLDADRKAVEDALAHFDPKTWQKTLNEHRKPYGGTAAEKWFKEAELVGNVKVSCENFKAKVEATKVPQSQKQQFLKQVESASGQMQIAYFRGAMEALAGDIRALVMPQRGKGQ